MKKKLLWVGDAGCPSGFAKATHNILDRLTDFDITVLGINYRGDPHPYDYPIYAAAPGGDGLGVGRLIWMCDVMGRPDVIVLQNDGWHLQPYVKLLRQFKEYQDIPVIPVVAVDGVNFQGKWLNHIRHAIFWTDFARNEAELGGYRGASSVIPLGVDRSVFYPMPKQQARRERGFPSELDDAFIVGNVNRNQPRKRWDLTIRYFAKWLEVQRPDGAAYLYLHTAPTGDVHCDVSQLAAYYGIEKHLVLVEPPVHYGIHDDDMRRTYNTFDVQISTTQGEGFGLTTIEGMACGVPQIVPEYSALAEICKDAALMVPCTSTAVTPGLNVIGGVPDEELFIKALSSAYEHDRRRELGNAVLKRAAEERFRWDDIAKAYASVFGKVLCEKEPAWA